MAKFRKNRAKTFIVSGMFQFLDEKSPCLKYCQVRTVACSKADAYIKVRNMATHQDNIGRWILYTNVRNA